MSVPQFPADPGVRIPITPQSFHRAQRREASDIATAVHGKGLRMEVHSGHTEFWADSTIPVGQVSVWAALTYKGWIEPVGTLASPDDEWWPESWPEAWKAEDRG